MTRRKITGLNIASDLENQIVNHELLPGSRLSTGRELAAHYGVSQKTVERALAQLIERGLISRVRGRGTFVESSIPIQHKQKICYLTFAHDRFLEDSADAIYAAYTRSEQGIQQLLTEAGYQVDHIEESAERAEDRDALLKIQLEQYDIVIAPAGVQDYADAVLRQSCCQKILVNDDQVRPGPWHQVVYDYRPGMEKALRYFQERKAEKIISVGFEDDEISAHRVAVFRQAALELGYSEGGLKTQFMRQNLVSRFFAGQAFAEYYMKNELFDYAIFSASDFLMIGMMMAFRQAGKLPQRDFQIVSYDNFQGSMDHPDFQFNVSGITHPQEAQKKAILTMLDNIGDCLGENDFYQTYFVPAAEFVPRKYI